MSYRAGSSHWKMCTLCLQRDGCDRQAVVFKRWLVDVQLVLMGTVCQVSPILSQHQLSLIEGRKKNKQTPHRKDTGFEPCEAKRPDNILPLSNFGVSCILSLLFLADRCGTQDGRLLLQPICVKAQCRVSRDALLHYQQEAVALFAFRDS